jgi:outer membrane protein
MTTIYKYHFSLIITMASLLVFTNANATELKIGFVNAPRVIEEAPQAEKARKKLEKEFSPRNKIVDKAQNDLRKAEDKLNRDGAIMSEPERQKLERKVRADARDLKRTKEEFREDLNIRKNEAFERLRRRVFEVIQNIASKEKYDLVVSEGVLHASKKVNITNLVLEQLKKENSSAKKSK